MASVKTWACPPALCLSFLATWVLVGCSVGLSQPAAAPEAITPTAANPLAAQYFGQRLKSIEADDGAALQAGETEPALPMDLHLALEYKATQQGLQHGQVSGIRFTYGAITKVESYVPHLSSYPATFLSLVYFDNAGALMGFTRLQESTSWRLQEFVDLNNASGIRLSRIQDGFAPAPERRAPYQYDPAPIVAYYLNSACLSNPGCTLDATVRDQLGKSPPPPGYRPGAVLGEVADAHLAQIVQEQTSYRANGFWASWRVYTGGTSFDGPPDLAFPWYRLASGGFVGFTSDDEMSNMGTGPQPGSPKGCFTVDYQAQFLNPLLRPGTYFSAYESDHTLLALTGTPTTGSSPLTIIGASSYVVGTSGSPCNS